MTDKKLKNSNVPNLRFPGFEGEWEVKKLNEFIDVISGIALQSEEISEDKSGIPILRGINITEGFIRHSIEIDRYYNKTIIDKTRRYLLEEKDLVIGMDGSKVGKNVALISKFDVGSILIQRVARIKALQNADINFIFQNIYSEKFQRYVDVVNTSSGIPHISLQQIKDFEAGFPATLSEQKKISYFLSLLDERIQTQNKIIEELKLLKNTIRHQLFSEIISKDYQSVEIRELLDYEQPTKYLVSDTDYSSDDSLTPVLTANKAFILGYTDEGCGVYDKGECIIFDDFTMDMKFVDFPFKVKSSAIKILTPKPKVSLRFLFEYLSFLNLSSNEHKRHYISEIEPMAISYPDYEKQKQVATALSSIDKKIKTETQIGTLLLQQKQYLLSNLFI